MSEDAFDAALNARAPVCPGKCRRHQPMPIGPRVGSLSRCVPRTHLDPAVPRLVGCALWRTAFPGPLSRGVNDDNANAPQSLASARGMWTDQGRCRWSLIVWTYVRKPRIRHGGGRRCRSRGGARRCGTADPRRIRETDRRGILRHRTRHRAIVAAGVGRAGRLDRRSRPARSGRGTLLPVDERHCSRRRCASRPARPRPESEPLRRSTRRICRPAARHQPRCPYSAPPSPVDWSTATRQPRSSAPCTGSRRRWTPTPGRRRSRPSSPTRST